MTSDLIAVSAIGVAISACYVHHPAHNGIRY